MANTSRQDLQIQYILVAEFDIDKGSILSHQYPEKIPDVEEQSLAEYMLPDGAHDREEDWTIFFLNRGLEDEKPVQVEAQPQEFRPVSKLWKPIQAYIYGLKEDSEGWEMMGNERKLIMMDTDRIIISESSLANQIFTIERGSEIDYREMDKCFVAMVTGDGTAIGFRFANEGDEKNLLNI